MGQVRVARQSDGSWLLHHAADRGDDTSLNKLTNVIEAREIALTDDAGNFRALKTAPTLRRGWRLVVAENKIESALDAIYPGAPGLWQHYLRGTLKPVPLRETLGRQTGMYRFANTISDDDAERMIACECDAKTKCLRRITWGLTDTAPLAPLLSDKLPPAKPAQDNPVLICVEACTHLVSAAREIARANHAVRQQSSHT